MDETTNRTADGSEEQSRWSDDGGSGSTVLSDEEFVEPIERPREDRSEREVPAEAETSPWERPALTRPETGLARSALALFIAALLGAGIGAGAAYLAIEGSPGGTVRVVDPPVRERADAPENQAAAVARAVTPSIVRIDSNGFAESSVGSGVIYRDDGYILTNAHVVEGASDVQVRLPSGEVLRARLVGSAAPTVDIAVIKVDRDELPAATFGSTEDLEVGDLAVAIGSPFGLEGSVTAGIISGLHRSGTNTPGLTDAIQTDAPINPGNSGGALANWRGEVIGINTSIASSTGGNVGIGFAIPVEIARKVADQIIDTGSARLAYLGISGQDTPGRKGALVAQVDPNGPAADAGIRLNDLIVRFDGEEVTSIGQLVAKIIRRDVGEQVEIVVDRDGERVTVRATLGQRPSS